jgi:hypothetical protein
VVRTFITAIEPGTALRGIYFWLWPPSPTTTIEVLRNLYADACRWLRDAA